MKIKLKKDGDAHRLLEDFIKYARLDPEAVASVMQYDVTGFLLRLKDLEYVVKEAEDSA